MLSDSILGHTFVEFIDFYVQLFWLRFGRISCFSAHRSNEKLWLLTLLLYLRLHALRVQIQQAWLVDHEGLPDSVILTRDRNVVKLFVR